MTAGQVFYLLSCLLVMGKCYFNCLAFKNKDNVFTFPPSWDINIIIIILFRKHIFFLNLLFAAAAKLLQSCPTLWDPIDSSPPGSPVPGILQARTLEWVAISFSSAWKWKVKVKLPSRVWLLATPWTAACQAPPPWDFPGKSTGVGCHRLLRIYFLVGGKLLYNVVLVSATQQCKWAIILQISPPSSAFLLSPHPILLVHHRVLFWAPCVI